MRANWVKQTTTSTGTGNLTLSSVTGFPTFAQQFALYERFSFCVLNASGEPIFSAIGYLSDSTTLVRELTLVSFVSGTLDNTAPAAVNLGAGTYTVVCAEDEAAFSNGRHTLPSFLSSDMRRVCTARVANWGNLGTSALSANQALIWPFELEHTLQVDTIYADISTAAAGKVLRAGIYNALADGKPGRLLADTGSMAADAIGAASATVPEMRLRPGLYWGVVLSDGTPAVRATGLFQAPAAFGGATLTLRYMNTRAGKALTYGALPTDWDWSGMTISHTGSSNIVPLLWLGVAP